MERRLSAPMLAKWTLACFAGIALALMIIALPVGAKQAWAVEDHPFSAYLSVEMISDDTDPLTPGDLPGFTQVTYDQAMIIGSMAPEEAFFLVYAFTDDGNIQYIDMSEDSYGEILTMPAKHNVLHQAMAGSSGMAFYYVTGTPDDNDIAPIEQENASVQQDNAPVQQNDTSADGGESTDEAPSVGAPIVSLSDDGYTVYFGTNCSEPIVVWNWLGRCGGPFNNGYMGLPDGAEMQFNLIDGKGHEFLGYYKNKIIDEDDPEFDPSCTLFSSDGLYRWDMTSDLADTAFWAIFDELPTPIYEENGAERTKPKVDPEETKPVPVSSATSTVTTEEGDSNTTANKSGDNTTVSQPEETVVAENDDAGAEDGDKPRANQEETKVEVVLADPINPSDTKL